MPSPCRRASFPAAARWGRCRRPFPPLAARVSQENRPGIHAAGGFPMHSPVQLVQTPRRRAHPGGKGAWPKLTPVVREVGGSSRTVPRRHWAASASAAARAPVRVQAAEYSVRHPRARGRAFFSQERQLDLEGVVADALLGGLAGRRRRSRVDGNHAQRASRWRPQSGTATPLSPPRCGKRQAPPRAPAAAAPMDPVDRGRQRFPEEAGPRVRRHEAHRARGGGTRRLRRQDSAKRSSRRPSSSDALSGYQAAAW